MSFGTRMEHRCAIERWTPATYDTPGSFAAHLSGVACRYWEEAVSETAGGAERVDRGGDVRLLKMATMVVPPGTDVTAGDYVSSVRDRNDVELLPRRMAVNGDPINLTAFLQLSLTAVS